MMPGEQPRSRDDSPQVVPSGPGVEAGRSPVPDASRRSRQARQALFGKVRASLRAQYFEIDRRLLAAFRIYFGLVLLVDLLRRFPYLTLFYTNDGVLPNHYALFAPLAQPAFSLFFACSTK